MDYLKIKRNLENYTVRNIPKRLITVNASGDTVVNTSSPNYYYGQIPEYKIDKEGFFILDSAGEKIPNTIDINIFISQEYDDMGIFTDMDFIPKQPSLSQPPNNFNPFLDGRIAGGPVDFYYTPPISVTGETDDSHLNYVKSLRVDSNGLPIYQPFLNVSKEDGQFDGVTDNNNQRVKYKLGADINNIGTTGVEFTTYHQEFVKSTNIVGEDVTWNKTTFKAVDGGWNSSNIDLYANVKEEEFLGIVFPPEISDDVFINRGVADIFERNAILSEIKTTDDLDNFRGGYLVSE